MRRSACSTSGEGRGGEGGVGRQVDSQGAEGRVCGSSVVGPWWGPGRALGSHAVPGRMLLPCSGRLDLATASAAHPTPPSLSRSFADSISAGRVSAVQVIPHCCVLAAVGQGMVARKGVAATMMSALAKANVNIKAIAQGSSEYNITVLIDQVGAAAGRLWGGGGVGVAGSSPN